MSAVVATMETVVTVAIAVLAAVFVASLVALLMVCRHKYCRRTDLISKHYQESSPDTNLVENMEVAPEGLSGVELNDVGLNTDMERILEDDTWVNDATGLAPHCIEILKTCHTLTEKLVGMTMGTNAQQLRNPEKLVDIVTYARQISPSVDDVVRSMYPPLDPRLLEARCKSLVLSVSYLVLVTKGACRSSGVMDWIDQSLADVQDHLKVLREASIAYEAFPRALSTPNILDMANPASPPNPNQPMSLGSPTSSVQGCPLRSETSDV